MMLSISAYVNDEIRFISLILFWKVSISSLYWNSFRSISSLKPHSEVISSTCVSLLLYRPTPLLSWPFHPLYGEAEVSIPEGFFLPGSLDCPSSDELEFPDPLPNFDITSALFVFICISMKAFGSKRQFFKGNLSYNNFGLFA